MSWSKCKDFGVIKVDGKNVKLYETASQHDTIHVNDSVSEARWVGDTVVVYLSNGKVRRYKTLSEYNNIS